MAQIEEGGKGGRTTTVELNLVPFIDLMSVCIIFLLITAVWTQVSMIQIGSSLYAKRTNTDDPTPPPQKEKVSFRLLVTKNGYVVNIAGSSVQIPKIATGYDDDRLIAYLKQIKEKYPDKNDCIISLNDSLTYENLIKGMDALMQGGFPEISIDTGEG